MDTAGACSLPSRFCFSSLQLSGSGLPVMADDNPEIYDLSEELDDGDAPESSTEMITDVLAKNPQCNHTAKESLCLTIDPYAVSKWMVMSPSLMKQREKQARAKGKKQAKKRAREDSATDDDDNDDTARKRKKKGKEKQPEEEEPVEITGYIHVLKPTATAPTRSRVKVNPETLYIKRGPFKFMSDCSYDEFTTIMAGVLPCPPAHMAMDKVEWKPQTPANRTPLPLGGSVGFDVLQSQLRSRTKDRIVILTMPGPRKPAADAPFWATTDEDEGVGDRSGSSASAEKQFDYSELEASTAEESVGEQKIVFDKALAPMVDELKERWPVNENGKRIYTDEKTTFQWELTPIQLNIWGAHMARGTATKDKAPPSTQFDVKYRIKSHATAPAAPSQPPVPQNPAAAPPSTSTQQILELMALTMLQQHRSSLPAPTTAIPTNAVPPNTPTPVPSAPSSPAKIPHRAVSLFDFCTHYDIMQHYERLQKLEYEPGDSGIKSLGREDWQNFAGFSKLAWDKVLSKHKQFCADIQVGLW
ncbi:hypothetical protein B0H19DRAFT_1059288 [Mycena capillaripes]|nr:hypothetical protein B0H19DRAFT_1059288 [Mycena capillaripes]